MEFLVGALAASVFWLFVVITSGSFRRWAQRQDDQINDEALAERIKGMIEGGTGEQKNEKS